MGEPAYRDVANAIRADIEARRLVEGDRLPTVRELAQRFGVPTGTVAKAVDILRADGVIVARHGRGLYVRTFGRIVRSSPDRLSRSWWGEGRSIQDRDTDGRLRSVHVVVEETPASGHVAEALGVPAGAAVLTRARRFAVEDRIVQTATSHLPLDVVAAAPAVGYTGPGPGGIYARLAEAGLGPDTFRESLVCRMPTSAEAEVMTLPRGTPVIAITRRAYTGNRRCVEINEMVLDSSAYELEYVFGAGDPTPRRT
jgi:GntR family transcriptional regulator